MNSAPILTFPACCALLLVSAGMLFAQSPSATPAAKGTTNSATAAAANSPSQLYLQGHLVMRDGTEKEAKGDFAGAYYKFLEARDLFDAAGQADKTWQPEIVEYRRKKIRADMERVRRLEKNKRATAGAASGSEITIEPAKPAGPGGKVRNTAVVMEERLRQKEAQIEALTSRNEDVLTKLGAREEELRAANSQILDARTTGKALREKLALAQTQIDTAAPEAKRTNDGLTKRVQKLEAQLGDAMSQLTAANSKTTTLLADLEQAYGEIKKTTKERDDLKQERDMMEAILSEGGGKAPEKMKIIAENQRLKKELQAAQDNVSKLTTGKAADQQEIASLRDQLTTVREQLRTFQEESDSYRAQIQSLTERLDETNNRLAETGQEVVTEVEAGIENKVLRGIILQQLKQQAKREAAHRNIMDDLLKEGVLDSMKSLGADADRILLTLNEMAAGIDLTKEQRGVLSSTRLDQFLKSNGVGNLMMVQDSKELSGDKPQATPTGESTNKHQLSPELKAYATAAEEQFNQGSFAEAENQYRKILLIEPMNVHALGNLGVVQLNKGDFAAAEISIRKTLAYDYDRAAPHYLLGVIYRSQNRIAEAVEEMEICIKLDPQYANAHLTLGLIAAQAKNRDEAEQHFKQAIICDPSNAYAHYNLAVLYARFDPEKKLALARQHYREALRFGANRDDGMDKLVGG